MKYTLTLGSTTLEASETSDRDFLKFGHVPVSKKQLTAIGFKLAPKQENREIIKHLKRRFGVTLEALGEQINKMRRVS